MKTINLKDYYFFYTHDQLIDVTDEIAELLIKFERNETAYDRRKYRYNAYFSMDRDDGIENEALYSLKTPYEIYEEKLMRLEIYKALQSLSQKQAKRVFAHYFLSMSKTAIANYEGVTENAVRDSIERATVKLKKHFKKLY